MNRIEYQNREIWINFLGRMYAFMAFYGEKIFCNIFLFILCPRSNAKRCLKAGVSCIELLLLLMWSNNRLPMMERHLNTTISVQKFPQKMNKVFRLIIGESQRCEPRISNTKYTEILNIVILTRHFTSDYLVEFSYKYNVSPRKVFYPANLEFPFNIPQYFTYQNWN